GDAIHPRTACDPPKAAVAHVGIREEQADPQVTQTRRGKRGSDSPGKEVTASKRGRKVGFQVTCVHSLTNPRTCRRCLRGTRSSPATATRHEPTWLPAALKLLSLTSLIRAHRPVPATAPGTPFPPNRQQKGSARRKWRRRRKATWTCAAVRPAETGARPESR